jgi:octaprenyl-diphosphate synthase
MKSDVPLVDLVVKYIWKQKGKKIRPLLVLYSSKIAGEINERSFRGATLVEMLHTATLIHDDVVDDAQQRRGFPSINAVWKNKVAVLMGDYLLSRGLMLSVENEDFDFLKTITASVRRMSEGELNQINKTKKLDIDKEAYFKIISDKTASLLSTCCEIGARSATEDEEKISALRDFGENLGIAFQIKDDILDYVGTSKITGKPKGGDIKEKKITLPLIHALSVAERRESEKIIAKIKKSTKRNNLQDILDFVEKHGGIEYSYSVAREYANKAKENLDVFENCEAKEMLLKLVDFVLLRNK